MKKGKVIALNGIRSGDGANGGSAGSVDNRNAPGNAPADDGGDNEGGDAEAGSGGFVAPGDAFGVSAGVSAEGDAGNGNAGGKRKRGRPKGSGKTQKAAKVPTSLDGIEGILLSLHSMAATFLKVPELQLPEEEAAQLAAGIARVAALYDFGASEKTLAWMNLFMLCGGVYGTRAFAYSMRVKVENEAARQRAAAKVVSIG